MSVWLFRAGKHSEHEERFFAGNRVYLTWQELPEDLSAVDSSDRVREVLQTQSPERTIGTIRSHTGQVSSFLFRMKPGDLVVTPRKGRGQYAVGEITGNYTFDAAQPMPYRHYRSVKWLNLELPKASVDLDIQFSLNAISTIAGVNREHADERVRAVATGKAAPAAKAQAVAVATESAAEEQPDFQDLAKAQIAQHIIRKFKGHRLADLVGAILEAQGYTVFVSPPGADGGIDILAAPAPLGFGRPRLCVQVKSSDSPVDSPTVNQLIGAMQNSQADQGLFVSWGGFKDSVIRQIPSQFFRVRLWDQDDLIQQLLDNYGKLSPDLKAELSLKQIWALAVTEEEGAEG
jgi:restriction system protein